MPRGAKGDSHSDCPLFSGGGGVAESGGGEGAAGGKGQTSTSSCRALPSIHLPFRPPKDEPRIKHGMPRGTVTVTVPFSPTPLCPNCRDSHYFRQHNIRKSAASRGSWAMSIASIYVGAISLALQAAPPSASVPSQPTPAPSASTTQSTPEQPGSMQDTDLTELCLLRPDACMIGSQRPVSEIPLCFRMSDGSCGTWDWDQGRRIYFAYEAPGETAVDAWVIIDRQRRYICALERRFVVIPRSSFCS
jgi:hypothetical protein